MYLNIAELKKGGVHIATPHPSKQAGKTPGNKNQQTPKSGGGSHTCKSCSRYAPVAIVFWFWFGVSDGRWYKCLMLLLFIWVLLAGLLALKTHWNLTKRQSTVVESESNQGF